MKRNLFFAVFIAGISPLNARANEQISVFDQLEAMAGQKFSELKVLSAVPSAAAAVPGRTKLLPLGNRVEIRVKNLVVPAGVNRVYISQGKLYYNPEDFFPQRGWMALLVSPSTKARRVSVVVGSAVVRPRASWSAPGYDLLEKAEGIESILIDPMTNGRFNDPTIEDFNGAGGGFVAIGPA